MIQAIQAILRNSARTARALSTIMGIAAALIALAPHAFAAETKELVLVVNAGRPETNLPLDTLQRIFRGDIRYWPNRQKISIVLPPEHSADELAAFVKETLNLEAGRFDMYWEAKRFRGEVTAVPQHAASEDAAAREAEASSNVIALLDRDYFAALPKIAGVKLLQVGGKNPGDAGYPLVVKK